jgi:hypothetical protein
MTSRAPRKDPFWTAVVYRGSSCRSYYPGGTLEKTLRSDGGIPISRQPSLRQMLEHETYQTPE